jgi:phosphoribosylaminoimidazolecarboxamide formyltransferase/IMP cyclohydrolase
LQEKFGKKNVMSVEDYANCKEVLDGRVKTLNESIHAGILARKNQLHELVEHNFYPIDMVVCNLYPFGRIVSEPNCSTEVALENIDIGGVAMLRGAAKNYKRVIVVNDPKDYNFVQNSLRLNGNDIPENDRKSLALKVFKKTAYYDSLIAEYFSKGTFKTRFYEKTGDLKYGCNPHQNNSAVWKSSDERPFELLNGNPSYINYLDAIGSWQLVNNLEKLTGHKAAASFKHTSPAGAAISAVPLSKSEQLAYGVSQKYLSPQALAYVRARNGDPKSSFGDFIACSSTVDLETAKIIKGVVSDGIVAPEYDIDAFNILKSKKGGNFIVLKADPKFSNTQTEEFREMFGMAISQKPDPFLLPQKNPRELTQEELDQLVAKVSLKYSQSNSVAMAKNGQIVGLGCGQQNRVDCVILAGLKSEIWHYRLQNAGLLKSLKKSFPKKQDRINKIFELIEKQP